jgi:ATP-dependent Lon protease
MNQLSLSSPVPEPLRRLPLLPVREVVVFPWMVLPLAVGRQRSVRAVEAAMKDQRLVLIAAQRRAQTEEPQVDDIHPVGTVSEILQVIRMPDGTLQILLEGKSRGRILDFGFAADGAYANVDFQSLVETAATSRQTEALMRRCLSVFEEYSKLDRRVPFEARGTLGNISEPGKLADLAAGHVGVKLQERQEILEILDPERRLEKLVGVMQTEIEILTIERQIHSRVRTQIEKTQKEYYLTEQLRAIQKELRQKDDFAKEIDELKAQIKSARMPREAEEAAQKETARLEKMMPFSPEATVVRTYLDWLVHLPWSRRTRDNLDIQRAERILNEDHHGLEKPKERILEYLAVLKRVKKIKGPVLCFTGPPGTGKTSLARSVARALGRSFIRLSLGGVRDESEIRGHRRTYIGSLPGRIIQNMRKSKSKSPVFLLDEIDKMGMDWRGDPAAALLEVLDPEQNHGFVDHYLDVGFDLSEALFITTANTLYNIPSSLQDRLEVIRFPGYTTEEKLSIAQDFLIPKQVKEHGLQPDQLQVSSAVLRQIIQDYTHESGVRNLERAVSRLCRKAARELETSKVRRVAIELTNIARYLGSPEHKREKISPNDVGVATGLAWTEQGGETLAVEVTVMPGDGKLILTGKLGEVMQESAKAALSYIRSLGSDLGLKPGFLKIRDLHIHLPEGAIPKDGPSAGIAIALAVASALTQRAIKKDMAMTGEITLSGRVLPIGGFKEKVLAAYREGIRTVLFPEGNRKDIEEIPDYVQKAIQLVPVKRMEEVIRRGLTASA